jgi:hypothetical protein
MRTLLALLCCLLPSAAWAAVIEGRVVQGEEPLAGMRVGAYHSLDSSAEPLALSAPSAPDGRFRLELPPGRYALFARDGERGVFAFCGRNPVTVGAEPVWAGLQAVSEGSFSYGPSADAQGAAVEGAVLFEGKPLEGAVVYLYLDVSEDLKGQGYRLSLPTGPDGAFAFEGLPESDYFLVARKREGGGRVGPVLEGDYLALYPGNPLRALAGKTARVQLTAVRKLKEEAGSETFARVEGGVLVRGTVVDRDGRPVAGLHVFAYTDRVIGHQRPAALSSPTGADGAFAVTLQAPGVYYVGARQLYGDSPAPGELFGMYDATADHGLTVEAGRDLEQIRIVVEPITLH